MHRHLDTMAPNSHHHVPSITLSLPWLFCLLVLGSTSAIRSLRMPAESAAGRYMSSGVVQRSVAPPIPAVSAPMMEMMADEEILDQPGVKLGSGQPGAQGGHWLGLGKRDRGDVNHIDDDDDDDENDGDDVTSRFTPYVSVGVLSNMQQFFDSLRNNLDSLEELPAEEKDLLLGRTTNEHRASRPTATAAYLHALRSHRPSHKLRNFVAHQEPAELRGSNMYDPAWLWAGLGRRRR